MRRWRSPRLLAAPAFAAPTKVSFRVEGASKTLLPAKTVTVPTSGSITKGGTPKGSLPGEQRRRRVQRRHRR